MRLTEPLTLLLMLAAFGLLALRLRWPIGVALAAAAWIGAACNGEYFPLRHLVEGAFSYLDPILVIATAMIFMRFLGEGGALSAVGGSVERRFSRRPLILLPLVMVMVMFPGMITGSSTASVLTTGAIAASILVRLGLARERAGAFVAMGGVLGMVAPPVNIPAMIIGTGVDLPYSGFTMPLAILAFPLALVFGYGLGRPLTRAAARVDRTGAGVESAAAEAVSLWRALLPPALAVILMLLPGLTRGRVPDPGLPLIFLAAAAFALPLLRRFPVRAAAIEAVSDALPVLAILAGVGAFIQVMTLTGARGWLVSILVGAPMWAIFGAAALSLPLFGAVSAFGSASVLGVPFLLVLLGRDEVVTTAGLSALAALGDLMLPAALAATMAAQVAGVEDRMRVLRLCIVPALATAAAAVAMLVHAAALSRLLA